MPLRTNKNLYSDEYNEFSTNIILQFPNDHRDMYICFAMSREKYLGLDISRK